MISTRFCLLLGLIASAVFIAAATVLGALLPGYDPVTQTISEIGERGSPFETIFRAVNLLVAGCFILFAYGVYRFSRERRVSLAPAALLGFFSIVGVGVFVFESPHPLHNVFGISAIPRLLAPLALAITWPSAPELIALRRVSAIAAVLLIGSIALNLTPLFVQVGWIELGQVSWIADHYGLVQRTLFVFHFWCAYLALVLFHRARKPVKHRIPPPDFGPVAEP